MLEAIVDAVVGSLAPSPTGDGSWDLASPGGPTVARWSPANAHAVLTPMGEVLVTMKRHGLRSRTMTLDPSAAAKAAQPVDPLLVVALVAHLLT